MSDKQYLEEALLDFVDKEQPEKVYVYKVAADLGGFAANRKHRFLLLEEESDNILLSLEPVANLAARAVWELVPDILGNWQMDADLFLQG